MDDSSPQNDRFEPIGPVAGGDLAGARNAGDPGKAEPAGSLQTAGATGNAITDITQLVLDHHEALYRYAYRLTGSAADAEDLTQQAFLVAHQKLGQLRSADCVRGWLFTVLRNGYLKNRRRALPVPAGNLGFDLDSVAAAADDRPLDSEALQQALGQLADEFKIVVLLFYFEQRSYREIADILEIPLGTVMSRLSRGKAQLRSKLFRSDNDSAGGPLAAGKFPAGTAAGPAAAVPSESGKSGSVISGSAASESANGNSDKVTIHA